MKKFNVLRETEMGPIYLGEFCSTSVKFLIEKAQKEWEEQGATILSTINTPNQVIIRYKLNDLSLEDIFILE